MNVNLNSIGDLFHQLISLMSHLVGLAFVVIMFAAVLRIFGHPAPYVLLPSPIDTAYLAGAWYLLRKAGA